MNGYHCTLNALKDGPKNQHPFRTRQAVLYLLVRRAVRVFRIREFSRLRQIGRCEAVSPFRIPIYVYSVGLWEGFIF